MSTPNNNEGLLEPHLAEALGNERAGVSDVLQAAFADSLGPEQIDARFTPDQIASTRKLYNEAIPREIMDPATGATTTEYTVPLKDEAGNQIGVELLGGPEGETLARIGEAYNERDKRAEAEARFIGAEAVAATAEQNASADAAHNKAAGHVVPPARKSASAASASASTTTPTATATKTADPTTPAEKTARRSTPLRPTPAGPSTDTGGRKDARGPGDRRGRDTARVPRGIEDLSQDELTAHLIAAAKRLEALKNESSDETAKASAEAAMVEQYGRVVTNEEKAVIDSRQDQIDEGLRVRQEHYDDLQKRKELKIQQIQQSKDLMLRMHGKEKYAERFAGNPNVDPDAYVQHIADNPQIDPDKWLEIQQSAEPKDLTQDGTLSDERLAVVYGHLKQHGHINEASLRTMFATPDGTPLSEQAAAKLVQQLQDSGVVEGKIDARGGYESTDPYIRINQRDRYKKSFELSEKPRKLSGAMYAPSQYRSGNQTNELLRSYSEQLPEFRSDMTKEEIKDVKDERYRIRRASNAVLAFEELQNSRSNSSTQKRHVTKAERNARAMFKKPSLRTTEQVQTISGVEATTKEQPTPEQQPTPAIRRSRAGKFMGKLVFAGNRRIKANMAPGLAQQDASGRTLTDDILGEPK